MKIEFKSQRNEISCNDPELLHPEWENMIYDVSIESTSEKDIYDLHIIPERKIDDPNRVFLGEKFKLKDIETFGLGKNYIVFQIIKGDKSIGSFYFNYYVGHGVNSVCISLNSFPNVDGGVLFVFKGIKDFKLTP